MASEVTSIPVNGNYAPHQGYGGVEQQNSYGYSNATASSSIGAQAPPATSTASSASGQHEIPKDEVGWFFVEQYYTTLSRNPEKLYLFYAKRSQLVSGQETEKVQVCVGQRAINDKIKQLDFQDCKVRVTNVDSQSSDSNIVIQVVGEISNKSQPHKKFVQTFVLAAQTNGYFVLNDIFRYLVEEEDEYEAEAGAGAEDVEQVPAANTTLQEPAATNEEAKTLTSSADPAAVENDAKRVSKELEEKVLKDQAVAVPAAVVSGNGEAGAAPAATTADQAPAQLEVPSVTEAERPATTESDLAPEKPKDPEPTPAASPPPKTVAAAPAAAPKPAVPAAPKTWANLAAAANKVATPAVSLPAAASSSAARSTPPSGKPAVSAAPTTTPPATATAPAPAAAAAAAAAAPPPAAPAAAGTTAPSSDSQDEWTAVGGGHSRQQSRQTNGVQQEAPLYRGYVKNVFEHIDANELRSALEKFGELAYFDIARQKNCAFVDFKTADGYNKATSTPIELGDDKLFVEERRVRSSTGQYAPRGQFQGGRGGRGGAGQGQGGPRGGFQGGARGNFTPRGRGGAPGQRGGRGAAQAS